MHGDLDLGDMTLSKRNDTNFGHGQQLCNIIQAQQLCNIIQDIIEISLFEIVISLFK